jgi:maltose alpha-D-glucosyltransferase/alpha-amylase
VLPTGSTHVLALCFEWRGNSVVTVHNFDSRPHEARFRVSAEGGEQLANLIVNEEIHADERGLHRVALDAYGYRWYRVGGLSYALRAHRDSGAGVTW